MDYSEYAKSHLEIEIRDDKIAIVTLNRPEKRNAITWAMHEALGHSLVRLGHDPAVSAVVLTGAGKAFCSGGDLVDFYPEDAGPLHIMRHRFLVHEIVNCEAPVIAAVNGTAAGLGATIALLCDVIYMADTARIGDTHVNAGLVAGDGGAVIWPALVGPHRAKEYLMSGKLLSGAECEKIGLVNHVVPADQLMDAALGFATELTKRPKPAVRWTKMLVNQLVMQNVNSVLGLGLATEGLASQTEDMKEAVAALMEKREPKFTDR